MMIRPPPISVTRLDDGEFEVRMRAKSSTGMPRPLPGAPRRHTGWSGRKKLTVIVRTPTPYSRQSVVIVDPVKKGSSRAVGTAALSKHAWYLEAEKKGAVREEGKETEQGLRAKFFNATQDEVRSKRDMILERAALGKEWDLKREALSKEIDASWETTWARERHHFRLIISPQNSQDIDMKQHVRDLLKQMEQDLGTKLEWNAVVHQDTKQPHAHVVVRGRRDDGRTLYMPRDYIANGLRHRSQDLATKELGLRYRDAQVVAAERDRLREQAERLKVLSKKEAREKDADISPSIGGR